MTDRAEPGQARLVMSDGTVDPEATRLQGLANAASPVLIGILAPIIVVALVEPSLLRHAHFMIMAVMLPMLLISISIYAYSVINPGDVSGLIVDAGHRKLQLVQSNIFAMRRTELSFNEVSAIRVTSLYDRDGYATQRAELELQSGQSIGLPSTLGVPEANALKYIIGLH